MQLDHNKIDPELRAPLEQFPGLDISRDNIVSLRAAMASQPTTPSTVEVLSESMSVATPDGDVPVFVYRKSDAAGQAALLWIHGGGYLFGSAEDERARVFADSLDCTVVSVDYRLAPEHPFPAGSDDCHGVLEWMFSDGCPLAIDRSRIAIGGASAGGGMAAGLAHMNRDRANLPIIFQLLVYPMIDNLHDTASGQYENHPIWNQGTSFNAWEMYLDGTPGKAASPYAAASRATDLSGLPPAYVCVGSEDLFRDEDLDYARRLIGADIPTEIAIFPGLYHAGEGMAPEAGVSTRINASILAALRDALR
jgi:acetyl esterase